MKLGINSLFILPYEFEEGLRLSRGLGAEMIEMGTLGDASRKSTPMANPQDRAWTFGLVGWGHDEKFWRDFITNLRFINYTGALSVEMEVDYMNVEDGVRKYFDFLRPLVMGSAPEPGAKWYERCGFHGIVED